MSTENMDHFLPSENKKDETVEVFFFFLSLEIMLSCLLEADLYFSRLSFLGL